MRHHDAARGHLLVGPLEGALQKMVARKEHVTVAAAMVGHAATAYSR